MVKRKVAEPARDTDTEQRILEAAKAVFVLRGTAGARMQEIAEEAGVNQALLHYYFRSKDRLADAVFRETAGRMFPAILGILGGDLPIEKKIDALVATYLDTMSRTPFLPGYILSELHHHPERMSQLLGNVVANTTGGDLSNFVRPVFEKLDRQLADEARAGRMKQISSPQFVVNLLSLCIFPFAARPMLRAVLGFDDEMFAQFIDQRRRELPQYIRNAMRP
ncbi:MAG TPA: TetR/AcrR family transcriptional regulator [Gemmatimonadaceae bacterium]|nr:TetR/AcrR family transcriptional regulator [Gemmatimonadaceae bacterium]